MIIELRGSPETGSILIWTGREWTSAVTKDGCAYDVYTRLWFAGRGRTKHIPTKDKRCTPASQAPLEFCAAMMMGRCADGAERDSGRLYHALPEGQWTAACGAKPGKRSAGWSVHKGESVTCKRCRAKMQTENPSPDGYPIILKSGSKFLRELAEEEYGSWEDFGCPEPGEPWDQEEWDSCHVEGREHPYNILRRHKGQLELRNVEEAHTICHHVLDNSIDKAKGFFEEARGWPGPGSKEYGITYRWLRNLQKLGDRIAEAVAERIPAAYPRDKDGSPHCAHCGEDIDIGTIFLYHGEDIQSDGIVNDLCRTCARVYIDNCDEPQ